MCEGSRAGMAASVRVCWRWKNSLICAARWVSTCTRDSPRSPTPSCRISRICSGAAFLVTAMIVTSFCSRLAFLQAAAIRSFTSLSLSANGDRLATQYSFGRCWRTGMSAPLNYKERDGAGIVAQLNYERSVEEISKSNRGVRRRKCARSGGGSAALRAANERVAGETGGGWARGAEAGGALAAHSQVGD